MARLYPLPLNYRIVLLVDVSSLALWLFCFARFLILLPLVGRRFLPGGISDFFHVVALTPLVSYVAKKALIDGKMDLKHLWALGDALRLAWICYGVIFPFPKIAKHTTYSLLIASWCTQYIVHYTYHGFRLKTRMSPVWLFWLKYHIFYVTVPLTTVAEMILIFLSLRFNSDLLYEQVLKLVFLCYIPAAIYVWTNLQARKEAKYDAVMSKRRRAALAATSSDREEPIEMTSSSREIPNREQKKPRECVQLS